VGVTCGAGEVEHGDCGLQTIVSHGHVLHVVFLLNKRPKSDGFFSQQEGQVTQQDGLHVLQEEHVSQEGGAPQPQGAGLLTVGVLEGTKRGAVDVVGWSFAGVVCVTAPTGGSTVSGLIGICAIGFAIVAVGGNGGAGVATLIDGVGVAVCEGRAVKAACGPVIICGEVELLRFVSVAAGMAGGLGAPSGDLLSLPQWKMRVVIARGCAAPSLTGAGAEPTMVMISPESTA
jgi:hypothetical protein